MADTRSDAPSLREPARSRNAHWTSWQAMSVRGKLGWALAGLVPWIASTWRRGGIHRVVAVALAPAGLLYALASVVRDSVAYRGEAPTSRRPHRRDAYLRHRFGGTQRIVHWRERRVAKRLCALATGDGIFLDAPAGYGRFTPLLAGRARRLVSTDIARPRLRTFHRTEPTGGAAVQADLRALPFRTGAFELVFHVRYLQHAHTPDARAQAITELSRVARRWIVVSYYRGGNLHTLVHAFQDMARPGRRRRPSTISGGELRRLAAASGCRVVHDMGVLPGLHAQRFALLEKSVP